MRKQSTRIIWFVIAVVVGFHFLLFYDATLYLRSIVDNTKTPVEQESEVTKSRILLLAGNLLKTTGRRCNLTPQRAYDLAKMFVDIADKVGVREELLAAVAAKESCFKQSARGGAQEIGMMQIKPGTASLYGHSPEELLTDYSNISIGASILASELTRHSPHTALLIYNQGHPGITSNPYPASVMKLYKELGGN
jgi:hypothetical protein